MRLGFPFSVSLTLSPDTSLRLANARASLSLPPPSIAPSSPHSLSLSLTCYSASIDSGTDHLIHPICIPLMLPVGHGMSAPTRRSALSQCRTYGIVYPRSRFIRHRSLNFHKSVPSTLYGKPCLIRARRISDAFRFR